MSRYIDADALFAEFENADWYNNADRDEIAERLVLQAPTIDTVEVVRCKDCKWRNTKRCIINFFAEDLTESDGMYYELTFNRDKNEWYLDAYKKFENRVIIDEIL